MNLKHSNKGYTLAETLIAIALMVCLSVIAIGALGPLLDRYEKFGRSKDAFVEQVLSTRQIWEDLKLSYLSFNALSVADDDEHDFFELYDDFPIEMATNITRSRQFTMELGAKTSFLFITSDNKRGPNFLYDPVSAYSVGTATSADLPATLSFVGLNKNNVISDKYPNAWRLGGLMMLYSPLRIVPQSNILSENYVSGRWPSFIGEINDQNQLIPVNANATIKNRNPMTDVEYTNEDEFLRALPSAGGAAPMVFVQPIRVVMYFLRATSYKGKDTSALYKTEWLNGQFSSTPFLIGIPIKKVVFKRASIIEPVISVDVVPEKF